MPSFKDRTGEIYETETGKCFIIKEYRGKADTTIVFSDGYTLSGVSMVRIKSGKIRHPLDITVLGVACLGNGDIPRSVNGKLTEVYSCWFGMLDRCYGGKYQEMFPTYIGCKVCDEWLNFQNFAKWYMSNIYSCDNERVELDKDLLIPGNKLYSPETCCFLPRSVNSALASQNRCSGHYPPGILKSKSGKFNVRISKFGVRTHLGSYKYLHEAKNALLEQQTEYFNQLAELYQDKLPKLVVEKLKTYRKRDSL